MNNDKSGKAKSAQHSSGSRWLKCVATNGTIRGVALEATGLIRELAKLHKLNGMQAQGLGEAVMAGLLVSSYCKAGERVNLNIRGSGQFTQGLVDANPDGTVRGYVIPREPKDAFFGEHNEFGPWGNGSLSILRKKGDAGSQPYIGTVPLITGHLAKDLTFYWFQSEQIPSAVGLAVTVDGDEVVTAGGFLVQVMPQASPEEVKLVEKHIQEIDSLTAELSRENDPLKLLARIFQSTAFVLLEDRPLTAYCNCSRERAIRALKLSGIEEVSDLLKTEGKASLNCEFCTKEYTVDADGLRELIASMT
ncbi:MAG: hypothetical protein A2070_13915 [Bdellovibrionales bacterium GWC1_52_8]|nr:MAG: hypothetical protein A2Z97_08335 [Bdellovibrionales bacterium GWB1_52_6]OFZ36385.1 MAG: hypothetical protein A2070_13915 [Bdellovibrionales bacterium GWC1_52_8]